MTSFKNQNLWGVTMVELRAITEDNFLDAFHLKLAPGQESFVLPAKAVHQNQYGKGLWAKIPADGHTTLTKPYMAG